MKKSVFVIFGFLGIMVFLCSPLLLKGESVSSGESRLFGIAADYNNVFFGDYRGTNGDIEGHAAIGGNLYASAYSFGDWRREKHSGGPVLVVGGDAYVSSSTVGDGDAYIGGNLYAYNGAKNWNMLTRSTTSGILTDSSYISNYDGTIYIGGENKISYDYYEQLNGEVPFDFAAAQNALRTVSSELMSFNATTLGIFTNGDYVIDLSGLSGIQTVFVDAQIFQMLSNTGKNMMIYADADTTLILNVTNELGLDTLYLNRDVLLNGHAADFDSDDFDGRNLLMNVDSSIENIDVSKISFQGSILAVDSHFDVAHGHVSGQAFGASATTTNGGEFHAYYNFDDKHFGDGTTNTPEPATILIFGIGLGGLALRHRLRNRK